MSKRDVREIGQWALVTAVVVVCAMGSRTAICNGETKVAAPAKPTLAGFELTGSVAATTTPNQVRLTIRATNPIAQFKPLDLDVTLERQEFSGNPMSRVEVPTDFKVTVEASRNIKRTVAPSSTVDMNIILPVAGTLVSAPVAVSPTPPAAAPAGLAPLPSITFTPTTDASGGALLLQPSVSYLVKVSHAGKQLELTRFSTDQAKR